MNHSNHSTQSAMKPGECEGLLAEAQTRIGGLETELREALLHYRTEEASWTECRDQVQRTESLPGGWIIERAKDLRCWYVWDGLTGWPTNLIASGADLSVVIEEALAKAPAQNGGTT